jgi:uncharacterized RDD family membrane protein YckC
MPMDDQSQTPPAPPAAPPPPPPVAGWAAPPPAAVPGAAGFVYADVPNRLIAWIIDLIVIGVLYFVVFFITAIVGLSGGIASTQFNALATIVFGVLLTLVAAGYFIWTWTSMRATVGMKLLGMQVGNAFDGKTLTMDQALRRALALWGPGLASSVFGNVPAIGPLISLVAFAWTIYLLYSTATSPTKQGFHDKFANSVVVKAGRVV